MVRNSVALLSLAECCRWWDHKARKWYYHSIQGEEEADGHSGSLCVLTDDEFGATSDQNTEKFNHPPSSTSSKAGRNNFNDEITALLPTRIGERCSRTI